MPLVTWVPTISTCSLNPPGGKGLEVITGSRLLAASPSGRTGALFVGFGLRCSFHLSHSGRLDADWAPRPGCRCGGCSTGGSGPGGPASAQAQRLQEEPGALRHREDPCVGPGRFSFKDPLLQVQRNAIAGSSFFPLGIGTCFPSPSQGETCQFGDFSQ